MTDQRALVRVVTGAQAAARDAAAIAAGTPSGELMRRAGTGAAAEIARRLGRATSGPVLIFTGPGNNGGDGWVVARALARGGVRVEICEAAGPRTPDAAAARDAALEQPRSNIVRRPLAVEAQGDYALVVDALLGTGSAGEPRALIAHAIALIAQHRARGAVVAALDLPSGLDATTGECDGAVRADLTLSFGTVKRGHLISRGVCGEILVLDIGLGVHAALDDGAPLLVDEPWVAATVPVIHADAHKGTRGKLAIVGGADGMSGAVILSARAALKSGAGMVKIIADSPSLEPIRRAEPAALTAEWPGDDAAVEQSIGRWADAIAIGPGLGNTPRSRALVERVLRAWRGPVVLDADALNVFAGDLGALAQLLAGRAAILTPHPAEFARLSGVAVHQVLATRFEAGEAVATRLKATVVLKGTPTVVFPGTPGERFVSASGTPVLATGGSGDLLTGIVGTLLTQLHDQARAAACAAWVHGRAAELAQFDPLGALAPRRDARGVTLDDVLVHLPEVWRFSAAVLPPPLLARLPAVEHAT